MTLRTILFISKGSSSASTRYRALTYFSYLQAADWQPQHITATSNLLDRAKLLNCAAHADVVVILRKTFSPIFLYVLRYFSKHIIFDFDDAIFVRSNGQPSALRMKRFKRMMKLCDRVWAGNAYLAESARPFNTNVSVLPTSVDIKKYYIHPDKPENNIDLVWIGSSSTRKYLLNLLPVLETLAQQYPQIRLKIIADFDLTTESIKTLPIQWSEKIETAELTSSHIGLAPMIDNPWTRGKCALKVLQYMASGLPVVSSPSGLNKDVISHEETGYLANTDSEWLSSLEILITDPGLREHIGASGQEYAEQNFSEPVTAKRMITDINTITSG